ncbi:MAG: AAA family ATPase [Pirellulales bacterium]
MSDQADNLRQLIDEPSPHVITAAPGPPMIAVTSGRAGVGVTTVAANLAAVFADRGARVLLIDAVQQHSNLAEIAGVNWTKTEHTLADVLAGKCTLAEAMSRGPGGTMFLVNRPSRRSQTEFSRHAQQGLLAELQSIGDSIDLLVVDMGSGLTAWSRRLWLRAQLVLLVTTSDSSALMDSYATIKRSVADGIGPDIRLVVNQCDDDGVAADAHRRLSDACCRFIGRTMPAFPPLPRYVAESHAHSWPRVWETPNTPFGHAALWLGRAVSDLLTGIQADSDCATACGEPDRMETSSSTARCLDEAIR